MLFASTYSLLALDLNQFAKEKKVTTLLTHVYCIWQKLFEKAKCKARNWERREKKNSRRERERESTVLEGVILLGCDWVRAVKKLEAEEG